MKTRIEDAANAWVTADEKREFGNGSYPQQHCHFAFIAGAEFMHGEVKDLEYQLEQQKIMNPISVNMIATISDLSEKLKVSVEALVRISEIGYCHDYGDHRQVASEALAAIKVEH